MRQPVKVNSEFLDHLPALTVRQQRMRPVYEVMEDRRESTRGTRSWADPDIAVKYIRRNEEIIEEPVALLSTSPER